MARILYNINNRCNELKILMKLTKLIILLLICLVAISETYGQSNRLRMATTTSTDNSGLLAVLNPPFEEQYNINIDVIAVGTGKALRLAENGDVDLVLVHAPTAEQQFVNQGYGVLRSPVMHNDFVLVGPKIDPANILSADSIVDAFRFISGSEMAFISRGDDSGTHKKELQLWHKASIEPQGVWYLSVGQGMGAVLRIADEMQAYTLSDRGTYLAYKDKISLSVLFEGDVLLHNPYHVILVNPERHPHVNNKAAMQYLDYLIGEEGQKLIREYSIGGELLFYPDVIP